MNTPHRARGSRDRITIRLTPEMASLLAKVQDATRQSATEVVLNALKTTYAPSPSLSPDA